MGHRNVKLVDTYQQVGFKKQQNGSRVLYRGGGPPGWAYILKAKLLAEFTFQVKKLAEKVRKSRQQNFATNVRKS